MRLASAFRRPAGRGSKPGFLGDTRGAAAIELTIWGALLILPILSVVDMGFYAYQRMQLEQATQVAAQAAWKTCDQPGKLPATINCAGLNAAIAAAVTSTSLGANATVQNGYPTEGYYCPDSSNVLQPAGPLGSPLSDCSVGGYPAGEPGDYIQIAVSYNYTPLFQGVSVASLLTTPITRTAWMRLG